MSKKNNPLVSFLNLKHTGKIVALINAALYSYLSYLVLGYIKESLLTSGDSFKLAMGVILLVLSVGVLSWFKDMITEECDMQSSINKEKKAHEDTRSKLTKEHEETKAELRRKTKELENKDRIIADKKQIIHAISCNLNNTIISSSDMKGLIVDIKSIMTKINTSKEVNNLSDLPVAGSQSDYLSMFCP